MIYSPSAAQLHYLVVVDISAPPLPPLPPLLPLPPPLLPLPPPLPPLLLPLLLLLPPSIRNRSGTSDLAAIEEQKTPAFVICHRAKCVVNRRKRLS